MSEKIHPECIPDDTTDVNLRSVNLARDGARSVLDGDRLPLAFTVWNAGNVRVICFLGGAQYTDDQINRINRACLEITKEARGNVPLASPEGADIYHNPTGLIEE